MAGGDRSRVSDIGAEEDDTRSARRIPGIAVKAANDPCMVL